MTDYESILRECLRNLTYEQAERVLEYINKTVDDYLEMTTRWSHPFLYWILYRPTISLPPTHINFPEYPQWIPKRLIASV